MRYPLYVKKIIDRIEESGEEAFIVGGCVRDSLLGIEPHDFDVTTSARPENVAELFGDCRVILTGLKHGTVTVISEGEPIEITTYRIDGSYSDSRHPDSVTFSRKIADDLSRRDFTVNAMAYNSRVGLIDIFGGMKDLEDKTIRAVGDARVRFSEDALRILRCFRFFAQLGFRIDKDTLEGAADMKDGLEKIAKERILVEFLKLIAAPDAVTALKTMNRYGILKYVIGQNIDDIEYIDGLSLMPCDEATRLGFILSRFGEERARGILSSLKASGKLTRGVCAVVRNCGASVRSAEEARRFIAGCGIYAESAIRAAVILGYSEPNAEELVLSQISSPKSISDLALTGRDLTAIGASGKLVGDTLDYLFDAVLSEPELNKKETLLSLAKQFIDANG